MSSSYASPSIARKETHVLFEIKNAVQMRKEGGKDMILRDITLTVFSVLLALGATTLYGA